jgi:tetratricopeptide (TPR) repeat protein
MTYRVALDDKRNSEKGKMAETWMEAAGQNGIPTAFLVDKKGILVWIGHPMTLKEQVIEDVLAGKFDLQRATADYQKQQETEQQLRTVSMALSKAMQAKDWDAASAKVDEIAKLMPNESSSLDMVRLNILFGKEDYPNAYKLASKISEKNAENAMLQNELAWKIATDTSIKQRDLPLAETMAKRAAAASENKDAAILDTLARVTFLHGRKDEAIALQEKALSLADSDRKAELEKSLADYKKGEISKAN